MTISVDKLLQAQDTKSVKAIIDELENNFKLAPCDDEYLRLLVKDTLEYLKTGKRSFERAHEKYQALKRGIDAK